MSVLFFIGSAVLNLDAVRSISERYTVGPRKFTNRLSPRHCNNGETTRERLSDRGDSCTG